MYAKWLCNIGQGSAMVIEGGIDCYQFITIYTQLVIILALEGMGYYQEIYKWNNHWNIIFHSYYFVRTLISYVVTQALYSSKYVLRIFFYSKKNTIF